MTKEKPARHIVSRPHVTQKNCLAAEINQQRGLISEKDAKVPDPVAP